MRLLDPWRLGPAAGGPTILLRRAAFDGAGGRAGEAHATIDVDGAGLAPEVVRSLLTYVELGKLSPPHLQALIDELRAARDLQPDPPDVPEAAERRTAGELDQATAGAAHGAAQGPQSLSALFAAVAPRQRAAFDDPMAGLATGAAHRAVMGRAAGGLVALLDRACALPPPFAEQAIADYVDLQQSVRRNLLAWALRLAEVCPSFTTDEVRAERDLFAWWRERATLEVAVEDTDGRTVAVGLPATTPPALAESTRQMLQALAQRSAKAAAYLAPDGRAGSGLAASLGVELLDGLAGLLLNGHGEENPLRVRDLASHLVPAAPRPTRAALCKEVHRAGEPLADALGRFFAIPQTTVVLPRTGRTVVVRSTGTCPFPDLGLTPSSDDPAQPTWLPPE